MIAEVLEKARAKVEAMEAGEYFSMLLKMVEKYALAQDGEICLCAADLARLPEGFEAEVSRIAKEKGGSLKLSGEGKQIKNGFILVYAGSRKTVRSMPCLMRRKTSCPTSCTG